MQRKLKFNDRYEFRPGFQAKYYLSGYFRNAALWLILVAPALFSGCSNSSSRDKIVQIYLKDVSGYMQTLYSMAGVPDAQVSLKGKTLGLEYNFISDSTGNIELSKIKADDYYISAIRAMSSQEMAQITGSPVDGIQLKNVSQGLLSISGERDTIFEITLEAVSGGSGLVISEIYACGPPNSGYYYHDKYVELFNQSDTTLYLDGIIIAEITNNLSGDTARYLYSKNIWYFPGSGRENGLEPGAFAVCALDGIDHTIDTTSGQPRESVDLSHVRFEFYKEESGQDVDAVDVPNMLIFYQPSGYDWLIGGEKDAIVISNGEINSLTFENSMYAIPISSIIDGVEYLKDPANDLLTKKLPASIDAGATGGIVFYTGRSMERKIIARGTRLLMQDTNNSALDFEVIEDPTPETAH